MESNLPSQHTERPADSHKSQLNEDGDHQSPTLEKDTPSRFSPNDVDIIKTLFLSQLSIESVERSQSVKGELLRGVFKECLKDVQFIEEYVGAVELRSSKYRCASTGRFMKNPVLGQDGKVYEASAKPNLLSGTRMAKLKEEIAEFSKGVLKELCLCIRSLQDCHMSITTTLKLLVEVLAVLDVGTEVAWHFEVFNSLEGSGEELALEMLCSSWQDPTTGLAQLLEGAASLSHKPSLVLQVLSSLVSKLIEKGDLNAAAFQLLKLVAVEEVSALKPSLTEIALMLAERTPNLQLREQLLKFPRVPLDSSSGRCYFLLEAAKTLFYIGKTSESLELVRLLHPLAGEDLKSEALIEGFYEDLRLEDHKRAFLLDRARTDIANLAGQRLPQSLLDCLGRVMRVIELDTSHRTWTTEQLQNIQQVLLDYEAVKAQLMDINLTLLNHEAIKVQLTSIQQALHNHPALQGQVSTLYKKLAEVGEHLTRVDADLQHSKTVQRQAREESKHVGKRRSDDIVVKSRDVYSYGVGTSFLYATDINNTAYEEIKVKTNPRHSFKFVFEPGCKLVEYAKGALICCGGKGTGQTWTLQRRDGYMPVEIESMAWARGWHGLVEYNQVVYAIGGSQSGSNAMKKIEAYYLRLGYWEEFEPMDRAVSHVTPVVHDATEEIFVVGGRNGSSCVDLVQIFDTATLRWRSEGAYLMNSVDFPFCFKASKGSSNIYYVDRKSMLRFFRIDVEGEAEHVTRVKLPELDHFNSVHYYQGNLFVSCDQGPAVVLAVGNLG
jgi:hypothetical protein